VNIKNNSWSGSKAYDEFMGKWSLLVARKFLGWLGESDIIENKKWLDVGCGTGVLSYEIANTSQPTSVLGIDPSAQYLPKYSDQSSDIIEFKVGSGNKLPVNQSEFDFIVSALALNFMSNKIESIKEMLRVLKPGGIIALYVWDYAEKMEFLRYFWDGVIKTDSSSIKFDEAQLFPICNIDNLTELFSSCGVNSIITKEIIIDTTFSNFDEYWTPFLGGQGPAGNYLQLHDEKKRKKIRDRVKEHLPISDDGTINLIARAFAIKGVK
jgi:ubiquinone/menaquinone biosynthesis C-methylase UbiE